MVYIRSNWSISEVKARGQLVYTRGQVVYTKCLSVLYQRSKWSISGLIGRYQWSISEVKARGQVVYIRGLNQRLSGLYQRSKPEVKWSISEV